MYKQKQHQYDSHFDLIEYFTFFLSLFYTTPVTEKQRYVRGWVKVFYVFSARDTVTTPPRRLFDLKKNQRYNRRRMDAGTARRHFDFIIYPRPLQYQILTNFSDIFCFLKYAEIKLFSHSSANKYLYYYYIYVIIYCIYNICYSYYILS